MKLLFENDKCNIYKSDNCSEIVVKFNHNILNKTYNIKLNDDHSRYEDNFKIVVLCGDCYHNTIYLNDALAVKYFIESWYSFNIPEDVIDELNSLVVMKRMLNNEHA